MRIEFETLEEFGQMIKGCNTDVNLSDNGAGADKSIIKKMIERKMIEKGAFELGDTMSTGAPENGVKKAALPPELFMGWDALDKGKKLEQLKQKDFTLFAVLMFDKFGTLPKDAREKMDYNVRAIYEKALKEHKVAEMKKLSWDELMKQGKTTELQKLDRDSYNEKYIKKYGVAPSTRL